MNAASPVIGPWNPIFGLSQPASAAAVAPGRHRPGERRRDDRQRRDA
jgi:hypothetical protein